MASGWYKKMKEGKTQLCAELTWNASDGTATTYYADEDQYVVASGYSSAERSGNYGWAELRYTINSSRSSEWYSYNMQRGVVGRGITLAGPLNKGDSLYIWGGAYLGNRGGYWRVFKVV